MNRPKNKIGFKPERENELNIGVFDSFIYPLKMAVVLLDNANQIEDLKKNIIPKSDICVDGNDAITFPAQMADTKDNIICVLFNGNQPDSVMVHEADHVANMMFCILGINLETNNDEPHAYLVEWAYDNIKMHLSSL